MTHTAVWEGLVAGLHLQVESVRALLIARRAHEPYTRKGWATAHTARGARSM